MLLQLEPAGLHPIRFTVSAAAAVAAAVTELRNSEKTRLQISSRSRAHLDTLSLSFFSERPAGCLAADTMCPILLRGRTTQIVAFVAESDLYSTRSWLKVKSGNYAEKGICLTIGIDKWPRPSSGQH